MSFKISLSSFDELFVVLDAVRGHRGLTSDKLLLDGQPRKEERTDSHW